MPNKLFFPHDLTSEDFDAYDAYAREHYNATRRASYARHPERVMRQRLTSAANLLNRYGLIDDHQKQTITDAIKVVATNG